MARIKSRNAARAQRHTRVRSKVLGTSERPRLNVYRSLSDIYVQIIDDSAGSTLISASTIDQKLREQLEGLNKTEQARRVGEELAKRAKDIGIRKVVFDRGGYRYMGRVKALADGAREAGLEF
jgi:large subunit ribosomal protein L18